MEEYWNGEIPWISIKDFNDQHRYILTTVDFITNEGLKNSSTNMLEKDDIIISARGTVGKINMIRNPMAFNQSCYGLRVKEGLEASYGYFAVKNSIRELKSQAHGSVFSTIIKNTFDNIKIPKPTFKEQKIIGDILSSLDNKIEINNDIIANLEEQAQAVFKSWFVNFEPFQNREFISSELGDIPENWQVKQLSNLFEIKYGKNLPTKKLEEKGYPVFGGNGQIGFYHEYLFEEPKILISCRGAASGKVVVSLPYSFITNNSLIMNELDQSYFHYYRYLFSNIEFENYATGSAQPQITIANIKDIKVCEPNENIINKFNKILNPIFNMQLNLQKENIKLVNLRDTLLPKLMSGEIRVEEAVETE